MRALSIRLGLFSLILTGLVLADAPANADSGGGCSVPICNPAQALAKFQAAASQDQYMTLQKLIATANQSTGVDALTNLNDFSSSAKRALVSLKADRTLIEAATQLSTICVQRLSVYSPLRADTLMEYFRQIGLEATRYDVLATWSSRVKDTEDRTALLEMSKFFSAAGKLCTDLQDDDYVATLAKTSEDAASRKLMRLQPLLEGVYAAQVTCGASSCPDNAPESMIDRLIILDALVSKDIEVNLVASNARVSVYHFKSVSVENGVSTIEAFGVNQIGAVARLHLDFDQTTATLSGTLETDEAKFRVSATQDPSASLNALFDQQFQNQIDTAIPVSIFEQKMTGTYAGQPVELKINVFPKDVATDRDETVGGTMTFTAQPSVKIRFSSGQFFPKTGILVLVGDTSGLGSIKIGLGIRPDAAVSGRYVFSGFSFGGDSAVVNTMTLSLQAPDAQAPAVAAPAGGLK